MSSVRERLIGTAVAQIERYGMRVSLDHLSLESIIAASGVSRASAYRHWSSKSAFLQDVLTTVVRSTRLEGESPAQVADLLSLLTDNPSNLKSEQGRRDLIVEGLRRAAQADFDRMASSTQWRTYLALHATCQGLPEGSLRQEVQAVLADTEARFTAHRALVYSRLPVLFGYRLVLPLTAPDGYMVMADAAGALMTGLVVRALTVPVKPSQNMLIAAFGSSRPAEWSWPAFHIVGLLLSHIERDPAVAWDSTQRTIAAHTLQEMSDALGSMTDQEE